MKKTYLNPFMEVYLLDSCDVIITSGVGSKTEGVGDIVNWITIS